MGVSMDTDYIIRGLYAMKVKTETEIQESKSEKDIKRLTHKIIMIDDAIIELKS